MTRCKTNSKKRNSSGHTRVKLPSIPLDMPGRYTTGNVLAVTGWSHSTLYNNIRNLTFPKPYKVGSLNFWNTSTVREALNL